MKQQFLNSLVLLGIFFVVPWAAWSGTVAGTGGATEITQILNNTESLTQTAQQIQMVKVQLQQALTNPNTPWSQTSKALDTLHSAVQQGQSMGYSLASVENNFKNTYKGYARSKDMLGDFIRWNNTTRDSINGALSAAGITADQLSSESGMIDQLRIMGQSAGGQMEATQVGNAIAVEMIQQMRKLRQLQSAQMQAHNAYMAGETDQKAAIKAAADGVFSVRKLKLKK